jgi:hypothetical protein
MCYSKEYSSSDGIPEFFRTGTTLQLAACKTSYMVGGKKTKTKRRKNKRKTRGRPKTKGRRKNIYRYINA